MSATTKISGFCISGFSGKGYQPKGPISSKTFIRLSEKQDLNPFFFTKIAKTSIPFKPHSYIHSKAYPYPRWKEQSTYPIQRGCHSIYTKIIRSQSTNTSSLSIEDVIENIKKELSQEGCSEEEIANITQKGPSGKYFPFLAAVEQGNKATISILMEKHEKLIHDVDGKRRNALHIAAQRGHAHLVPQLARYISTQDEDDQGLTPLYYAIQEKAADTVGALLQAGVSLTDTWTINEKEKIDPLRMAVVVGHIETIQVMISHDIFKKVDLSQTVHGIGNLLHLAIRANQGPMLEFLLTSEDVLKLINQTFPEGQTPLQLAAELGDLNAIYLLHKQGARLDYGKGEKDGTAVHFAARGGHADAIELLYNLGADIDAIDKDAVTPQVAIKDKESAEAKTCRARILYLRGVSRREVREPPNFARRPPHNLVFQGGGPKGIAYVGALEEMERLGTLSELKRIAGTSVGSIIAAFVAVGLKAEQLKVELDFNFEDFLDFNGDFEEKLMNALNAPGLKDKLIKGIQTVFYEYLKGLSLNPFKRLEELKVQMMKLEGLADGEKIRLKIEEIIKNATNEPFCTFGELEMLIKKEPKKYKELYIYSICIKTESNSETSSYGRENKPTEIVCFSHENPMWKDLIISDAIRASISIPGVYKPHTLHFKDFSKKRHPREDHGQFIDGGLVKNFPINAFDAENYQGEPYAKGEKTNRRTLGLSFRNITTKEVAKKPFPAKKLGEAFLYTYLHAQRMLLEETGQYKDRTIVIPVQDVGLLDLEMSDDKKQELINAGKKAAREFLKPSSTAKPPEPNPTPDTDKKDSQEQPSPTNSSTTSRPPEPNPTPLTHKNSLALSSFGLVLAAIVLAAIWPKEIEDPPPIPPGPPCNKPNDPEPPIPIDNIPTGPPYLVNREKPISKIHSLFLENETIKKIIAITGVSGSGKTELANQYARTYSEKYRYRWVVKLQQNEKKSEEIWKRVCNDIAKKWHKPVEEDSIDTIKAVNDELSKSTSLIILDEISADILNDLIEMLPHNAHILWTSKDISDQNSLVKNVVNLSDAEFMLTHDEGIKILEQGIMSNRYEADKAEELVQHFIRMPTAAKKLANFCKIMKAHPYMDMGVLINIIIYPHIYKILMKSIAMLTLLKVPAKVVKSITKRFPH